MRAGVTGQFGLPLSCPRDEILVENVYRNPEGNALILDTILLEKVVNEPNITLLLNTAVHDLEKEHLTGEHPITGARQTLVLMHEEATVHPRNTTAWLDRRPVDAHLHIRPALPRDTGRLARIVSGNAMPRR